MNLAPTYKVSVAILATSITVAAVAVGMVVELVRVVDHAYLYSGISLSNDQHFYFPMARAWLNGFGLYRDLFETKPPGIYLIAALSLRFTGGNGLLVYLQWTLLACFGPILAYFACSRLARPTKGLQLLVTTMTLLLGTVFAVQTLTRSLGYQPEGFALLFATLPALCLASPAGRRRRWVLDLLGGTSIGIAAMIKEPFAASAILAMLIVCRDREDIIRLLRVLIVGGLASMVILICSGAFGTYFAIYLPEIFSGRSINALTYAHYGLQVQYVIPTPLWVRSLQGVRILGGLSNPISNVCFPAIICVSLSLWGPLRLQDVRLRSILASTVVLATAAAAAHQLFVLLTLTSGLRNVGQSIPWDNPILIRLVAMAAVPPLAVAIGSLIVPRRLRPNRQIYALAAIAFVGFYSATSLVAFGGNFDSQYFVFVFPPAAVLAHYCIVEAANGRHWFILAILVCLSLAHVAMPNRVDYSARALELTGQIESSNAPTRQAKLLDALLTGCREDRYLLADDSLLDIPVFTTHSPFQIQYGQVRALGGFNVNANQVPNRYLAAKLNQDLTSARIIVAPAKDELTATLNRSHSSEPLPLRTGVVRKAGEKLPASAIPPQVATVIHDHFTTTVPPCAAPFMPIEGLQLFFRRS